MTSRALLVLTIVWFHTGLVYAQSIATDAFSGVSIEYQAPQLVSRAHAYIRVTIENTSGRDRSWTVESDATQYGYGTVGRWSQFELEVEDGQRRTFDLLLPVQDDGNGGWVQLRVYGYGVTRPGPHSVAPLGGGHVGVSTTLGEGESAPELARALGGVVSVSAADFPGDWRAFHGFTSLWLPEEEWERIPGPPKRAVEEWVARGQKLVLVSSGLPSREIVTPLGLGTIVTVPPSVSGTDSTYVPAVRAAAMGNPANWASRVIPTIETREGLLSLLLLGYLGLVVPVNLFVFAPKTKRLRLFWTMPAIALGASLVLAVVIVLQDGVGGSGRRADFVYLMPELNRELILQEQVSRTGALLSRRFELEEGVVLTDVTVRHAMSQVNLKNRGASYHGDWFRSRSVQAQRLEHSRSSRARIEWTDGPASATILSSIEDPLETLFYRADDGRIFRAENVLPGRPASLTEASESDYDTWRLSVGHSLGPQVTARLATASEIPGTFVAAADVETSRVPIETLRSIDWKQDAVLYAGRIEVGDEAR